MMAALAVSSIAANAQVWVGGSVSYLNEDSYGTKDNYITVAPEVGYTLDENWALAIDLTARFRSGDSKSQTTFGVTPFARYTFFRSGIVSAFVDGGFNVSAFKQEGDDSKTTWGVGVRPGLAIALTPKFSFVTKLGYLGYENDDRYEQKRLGFGVNGEGLSFGLYYNF